MLAQRERRKRAGGLVSSCARRGRTRRRCSLDARSWRRPSRTRGKNIHRSLKNRKATGRFQACRLNASPCSVSYSGSDCPRNLAASSPHRRNALRSISFSWTMENVPVFLPTIWELERTSDTEDYADVSHSRTICGICAPIPAPPSVRTTTPAMAPTKRLFSTLIPPT